VPGVVVREIEEGEAQCLLIHARFMRYHKRSVAEKPVLLRAYYCDLDGTVAKQDNPRQRLSAHIEDTTVLTHSV
jgi:hypothetical protein